MKIFRLKGGLGNQLFIIAAALHARRNEHIFIDARPTHRIDRRPNLRLLQFLQFSYFYKGIIAFTLRILAKLALLNNNRYYHDDYYQSPETLLNITEGEKIKLATFLNLLPLEPQNVCVIHIRLGDFVKQMPNYILSPAYYTKEIEQLPKSLDIIVISDAKVNELKENGFSELLQRPNVTISTETTMTEHFKAIANASHVIGSNSTFCLWATYLGHSLCPKKHIVMGPTFSIFEICFND